MSHPFNCQMNYQFTSKKRTWPSNLLTTAQLLMTLAPLHQQSMTVQIIHIAISTDTGEYSWRMPSQSPLDSTPGVFLALHHDKTPIQDITYPGYHLTLAQHSEGLPSTHLSGHPTSSLELPQTIILTLPDRYFGKLSISSLLSPVCRSD